MSDSTQQCRIVCRARNATPQFKRHFENVSWDWNAEQDARRRKERRQVKADERRQKRLARQRQKNRQLAQSFRVAKSGRLTHHIHF